MGAEVIVDPTEAAEWPKVNIPEATFWLAGIGAWEEGLPKVKDC